MSNDDLTVFAQLGLLSAEEAAEWSAETAAALAFAMPAVRPRPEVRQRLLSRIAKQPEPGLGAVLSTEGRWRKAQFPGITFKPLYFDKPSGLLTMLVRMEPGARHPAHVHSRTEQCLVLEGDLRHGDHVYTSGDFTWAEAGSLDPELHTEGGNLLLIVAAPENEIVHA